MNIGQFLLQRGSAGRANAWLVSLAVCVVLLPLGAHAAVNDTILISAPNGSTDGTANNGESWYSRMSISADGRYVAFGSEADNLVTNDNNAVENVYLRDTVTNTTKLVSAPNGSAGGQTNSDDSEDPAVSADGRYVAFVSDVDNLAPGDNSDVGNVYRRDTVTNVTTLVSVPNPAISGYPGSSYYPSISADGRYVAFGSAARLTGTENETIDNVYLHDAVAHLTKLVSAPNGETNGVGFPSYAASVSANGRYVAFYSNALDLAPGDNDTGDDVYLRDTFTNATTLVSAPDGSATGAANNAGSYVPSVSADGRYVAFYSDADNLAPNDNSAVSNVYLRDTVTNSTKLVSAPNGTANGTANNDDSSDPSVSADGRYVGFHSQSDDMTPDINNVVSNVYLRDTVTNTTTLVSAPNGSTNGAINSSDSLSASVSADARYVAFLSAADDLAPNVSNFVGNVYRREVDLSPPASPPAPSTGTCAGVAATLTGTEGAETLTGTSGNDVIAGLGGNDTILGLGGNDIICGGDGNDILKGGAGADRLYGEAGRDKLKGGAAKDYCNGGLEKDKARKCEKAKQI